MSEDEIKLKVGELTGREDFGRGIRGQESDRCSSDKKLSCRRWFELTEN